MNFAPYIGISGFTSYDQVELMREIFQTYAPIGSNRILHVGAMMNFETLNDMEMRWAKSFPAKEKIADIFGFDDVYNCLHYVDYRYQTHYTDLARAIEYGGVGIDAVQLDMPWPDPGTVASGVHASRKQLEVILQVGDRAIIEAHEDPNEVVRFLEPYETVIHRVLLDRSMGRGLAINAQALLPYARAIRERFPQWGLVVAGGFGPNTLGLAEPIRKEFPDVSIDAEGKLRPSGNSLDPVDWDMAAMYLKAALDRFC